MQAQIRRRLVKVFDGVYMLNQPSTNSSLIHMPNLSCKKITVYKSVKTDRIGFVYVSAQK